LNLARVKESRMQVERTEVSEGCSGNVLEKLQPWHSIAHEEREREREREREILERIARPDRDILPPT